VSFIDTPRLDDDDDDGAAAKDDSASLKINSSNISNVTSFVAAGATSMQRAGSVTSEAFQHDLRRLLTRDMNARDVPDFLRLALDFAEQKHLEQSRRDAVAALNASVSSVSRLLARCADGASQMHDEAAGQWRHVQEAVRAAVAVEFKAVMQAKVQRATERLQAELCEDAARLCEQIVAGHIGQAAAQQTSEMKNFAEQLLSSQQVVKAKFESVASKILNSGQQQ
jgi:hypothetical protein